MTISKSNSSSGSQGAIRTCAPQNQVMVGPMPPLVDCNVHLWDQTANPIFWLTDRTLVRDMLGDYDSLPETYTLADYQREVAELVERFRTLPLARSVRVRLVPALAHGAGDRALLDDDLAMANLELLARHELVATLEATGDQLGVVADLAGALPALRIVVDHFGWPQHPGEHALASHRERLCAIAAAPNTATRIDAIGTIFGNWSTDRIRPWLRAATDAFGPERCMLGSDLPIERLRSGFGRLYDAYRDIFSDLTHVARDALFGATAARWYRIST
jgi:predicted TIM-barrel fold metal-dependent hydrolase